MKKRERRANDTRRRKLAKASKKEIARLQESLLAAVLSGETLLGLTQAIRFPDLPLVLNQPRIILVKENLAGPLSIKKSPKPIRIVSRRTLLQEASEKGDITYLLYQPPEIRADGVRLTLEARIAPHDPSQRVMGLSGIQVKFRKISGRWQVSEEPRSFAA